jgi:hypothetical protein
LSTGVALKFVTTEASEKSYFLLWRHHGHMTYFVMMRLNTKQTSIEDQSRPKRGLFGHAKRSIFTS